MTYPLTITTMLQRSRWLFPGKEIVSRDHSGIHRHTYGDFYGRAEAVFPLVPPGANRYLIRGSRGLTRMRAGFRKEDSR